MKVCQEFRVGRDIQKEEVIRARLAKTLSMWIAIGLEHSEV
jgi:hypothetical protein